MITILEYFYNSCLRFFPTLLMISTLIIGYQFFRVSFEMHKNEIKRERSVFYMGVILYLVFIYLFFMEIRLDTVLNPSWLPFLYLICSFFWWLASLITEKYLPSMFCIDVKLHEANSFIARIVFFLSLVLLLIKIGFIIF
ncbi:MAG: hypothetical protein DDT22_00877 [candidate division WS2 bacterium]|nr:hypothetical protein [Candidatus Lithacetigena glycinireducens]